MRTYFFIDEPDIGVTSVDALEDCVIKGYLEKRRPGMNLRMKIDYSSRVYPSITGIRY